MYWLSYAPTAGYHTGVNQKPRMSSLPRRARGVVDAVTFGLGAGLPASGGAAHAERQRGASLGQETTMSTFRWW